MALQDRRAATGDPGGSLSPGLTDWMEQLERGRWPGFVVSEDFVLRFVSTELRVFMARSVGREVDDVAMGIGLPFFEALFQEAWTSTMSPDSLMAIMPRAMSYLKGEFQFTDEEALALLPKALVPFYESSEAQSSYGMYSDRFMYTVPGLPEIAVEFLLVGLRDKEGRFTGAACVSQMGLRPTLVNLLARGDERMYERMADLQDPRRCQGAILFADLQGSTRLSRTLPTSTYFSLIRALATEADAAIASNNGVVGKHAGDGVTGFFLISEDGDASHVAASAIAAARHIRDHAEAAIKEVIESADLDPTDFGMNVGLHWGASIFIGQLVPGGRLDVTALGDSVNECARIQEAAQGGSFLASKQLVEHLSNADAARLDIDLDGVMYRPISELEDVSAKVAQDAGLIPVTRLT